MAAARSQLQSFLLSSMLVTERSSNNGVAKANRSNSSSLHLGLSVFETLLATGGSACVCARQTRAGGTSRPAGQGQGQLRTPSATSALADAVRTSATRPTAGPGHSLGFRHKAPHPRSGSTPQLDVAVAQPALSQTNRQLWAGYLARQPAQLEGHQPFEKLSYMAEEEIAVKARSGSQSSQECLAVPQCHTPLTGVLQALPHVLTAAVAPQGQVPSKLPPMALQFERRPPPFHGTAAPSVGCATGSRQLPRRKSRCHLAMLPKDTDGEEGHRGMLGLVSSLNKRDGRWASHASDVDRSCHAVTTGSAHPHALREVCSTSDDRHLSHPATSSSATTVGTSPDSNGIVAGSSHCSPGHVAGQDSLMGLLGCALASSSVAALAAAAGAAASRGRASCGIGTMTGGGTRNHSQQGKTSSSDWQRLGAGESSGIHHGSSISRLAHSKSCHWQ
jgi:hypothetical protein